MRAALGASRGRIARALLSESVVLALAGGLLGVSLAQAAIGVLRSIAPAELPRVDDIGIDWMVLLFTMSVSVLSGALCGVLAVIRFGKPSITALKEGGRSALEAPGRHRTRDELVVGQVALALTLLIVSGLMIRTFIAMRQVHPGFTRPQEVQTFVLAIPASLIADPQQTVRTFEGVAEQLRRVPGVISVGLSSSITMEERQRQLRRNRGIPRPGGTMVKLRRFKSIGPGYFETMGNRLVAGRSITWNEIYEQRPVVIISEALAREYWGEPGEGDRPYRACLAASLTWLISSPYLRLLHIPLPCGVQDISGRPAHAEARAAWNDGVRDDRRVRGGSEGKGRFERPPWMAPATSPAAPHGRPCRRRSSCTT